ncbi:hypothetical protein EYF80_008065 [Liparis tanakae]|uniref:Uncharacterized protein n=1 Tax=Liparis tanakae TaxID=230148 RepID=A0A4Z2IUD4_9TELE|nr:hypothetical protein EYF80_008065 [Liparis tanakae]
MCMLAVNPLSCLKQNAPINQAVSFGGHSTSHCDSPPMGGALQKQPSLPPAPCSLRHVSWLLTGAGGVVFSGATVGTAVARGAFLGAGLAFLPPVAALITQSGSRYISSNKMCRIPMVV